jgi:hypothetical protein
MCSDICAHCAPCETSTPESRHWVPRLEWHELGHPTVTPWTTHAEYLPERAGFTAREVEILDEHAGELDRDLGAHKWGPEEMRAYIGDRLRESGDDPALVREFAGILAKYQGA